MFVFQVEGDEESDLIDDSVENVDQLFKIIAEDELKKLEPELDEEEYQEVQNISSFFPHKFCHSFNSEIV